MLQLKNSSILNGSVITDKTNENYDAKYLISVSNDEYPTDVWAWYSNGTIYWYSTEKYPYISDATVDNTLSYRNADVYNAVKNKDGSDKNNSYFSQFRYMTDISGIKDWTASLANNFNGMFFNCASLADYSAIKDWDTSSLSQMAATFTIQNGNRTLRNSLSTSAHLTLNWDMSNLIYAAQAFNNMSKTILNSESNWDLCNLVYAQNMFCGCSATTNFSFINSTKGYCFEKVIIATDMFNGAGIPRNDTVKALFLKWDFSSLTPNEKNGTTYYAVGMFRGTSWENQNLVFANSQYYHTGWNTYYMIKQ